MLQIHGNASQSLDGVAVHERPAGARPRVPASPKALLAEGEIGKIQDALARRGYLEQHRPGALDDPTTKAIRRFQKDEGLAETGFPDRLTLQELGLDPEEAYGKVRDESKDAGSAGSGRIHLCFSGRSILVSLQHITVGKREL